MKNRFRGFTLIELLVTLAVLAIAITIGVPSLRSSIANNNISAMTSRIVSSLNLARSRAISSNTFVTVRTGDSAGGNGTDWTSGWTVYTSSAAISDYAAGADVLLKAITPKTSTLNVTSNTGAYLTYQGNGMLAAGSNTTITVCDENADSGIMGRMIAIAPVGRVTITTIAAGDCL